MAFGFLKAPFKLITAPVRFVARKVVKPAVTFVARNPQTVLGTLLGGVGGGVLANFLPGIIGGGGQGRGPPDGPALDGSMFAPTVSLSTPPIVEQPAAFPASDRFSLAQTFANFIESVKGTVEEAASKVTVKPRLSGPIVALVGVGAIAGVIGLVVAIQRK